MKKLLKQYSLNSDMQYFEMIVESYLNGQILQAKEQFKALPKTYKKDFIIASILHWNNGLTDKQTILAFLPLI